MKVIIEETDFLAVAKACKAIFYPIPGLAKGTFDSSDFSETEETLISVSVVPHQDGIPGGGQSMQNYSLSYFSFSGGNL